MKLLTRKTESSLKNALVIQGTNGNWDYNEYMRGMYNGMEIMMAIIEKRDPVFKDFTIED